jgi:hypothetical protein
MNSTVLLILILMSMIWVCPVFAGKPDAFYPPLSVNTQSLRDTVEYLSTLDPPRSYNHIESVEKVSEYIFNKMNSSGLKPEYQEISVMGNRYRNIIAHIGPVNAPVIIIGAHYDVAGDQPGADDNASAVSGLLEAARLLFPYRERLKVRISFISWCLEEPPFFGTKEMGSYFHAKSLFYSDRDILGAISLEMIGYYIEEPASQKYPVGLMKAFYPEKGNFIAVVGNLKSGPLVKKLKKHMRHASIDVISVIAPGFFGGISLSDHRNYWKFGYKAAMITDTAFFRNPNYHLKSDTADTLNFDMMGEVIKGVVWALLNME